MQQGTVQSASAVTVTDPPAITVSVTTNGSSFTASAQGGTGTLTYSIDGTNFQTSPTFAGLIDNTYTLTVRDANGCLATTQVVINTVRLTINANITVPIRCAGETGTIQASAAGGPMPYTYRLNGGAPQTNPTFSGLSAGSYEVSVTDNAGTTATAAALILTAPTALSLSATVTQRSISLTATGGTAPYTYSIDGFSFGSTSTFNNLANGNYTLTVKDANGCTATTTARVEVNDLTITLRVAAPVNCAGNTDGAIAATVSGGRPPYSYSLNGGPSQNSAVFTGLGAGTYTITVMDADGLTRASAPLTLTGPSALTITAAVAGSDITLTAGGGTAPYTYAIAGMPSQNSNVFSGLAAGDYAFVVTDARGCQARTNATVVAMALAVRVEFRIDRETCPGAADGAVILSGVNGVPQYTYSIDGVTYRVGAFYDNLAPGTYTAYVRDGAGTIATTTFVIGDRPVPTVETSVQGSLVRVTSFSGASSGVTYSFDGGVTFSNEPSGFVYAPGPRDIVIRYGSNCSFRTTVDVTAPLQLSASDVIFCPGDTAAVSNICVEGGFGTTELGGSFTNFTAAPSAICANNFTVRPPATTGTYVVRVTDAVGARREVTFSATAAEAFTVSVRTDGGTLVASVRGGNGPFTYSIDGGVTTNTTGRFTGLTNQSYTVTVTDRFGCSEEVVYMFVNVANVAETIGLRLYPNPARESVRLDIDRPELVRSVQLITVTCQRLRSYAGTAVTGALSLEGVVPGYYVIEVDHEAGRAYVPLVVE